jgi:RNA polymerase sigma-70 factor (ECF subfamily)
VEEIEMKNNIMPEVNTSFYEKYNPQICAIVARILTNANHAQDIEDCVNTVFLEIMERLQQYNETRGSMGAFVAVIARSVALNYCKSNARKSSELVGDEKIDFMSGPIKVEDDVEFKMLVEQIVAKLNEQENILFSLRYLLYYSPEEIARVFKIKRNAVDARLNRLKSKVKTLLTKGGIVI